jgi:hypothetical protein
MQQWCQGLWQAGSIAGLMFNPPEPEPIFLKLHWSPIIAVLG